MSKIDAFLKNKKKFERETKDVEFKGLPVTIQALSYDEYVDAQSKAKIGKSFQDLDPYRLQIEIVMLGLLDPKPSEFQQLDKNYATPKEAVKGIFGIGGVGELANSILELSGLGGDSVTEIKND